MTDSDEVKLLPCPMRDALTKCRDKFREYEQQHEAKAQQIFDDGKTQGLLNAERMAMLARLTKAARNREMAEMCDEALATRPPVVTDEVVERVARFADTLSVNRHYMTGQTCREVQNDLRALLASMPAVVSGGQGE